MKGSVWKDYLLIPHRIKFKPGILEIWNLFDILSIQLSNKRNIILCYLKFDEFAHNESITFIRRSFLSFKLPDVIRTLHCEAEALIRKNVRYIHDVTHSFMTLKALANDHTARSHHSSPTNWCQEVFVLKTSESNTIVFGDNVRFS